MGFWLGTRSSLSLKGAEGIVQTALQLRKVQKSGGESTWEKGGGTFLPIRSLSLMHLVQQSSAFSVPKGHCCDKSHLESVTKNMNFRD